MEKFVERAYKRKLRLFVGWFKRVVLRQFDAEYKLQKILDKELGAECDNDFIKELRRCDNCND